MGSGLEPAVLPAAIEERLAIANFERLHFADEDRVVARHVLRDDVASEMRQGVFQKRDTCVGPEEADPETRIVGRVLLRFSKKLGHALLRIPEYAYAKATFGFQVRQKAGVLVHTDQNQRRVE